MKDIVFLSVDSSDVLGFSIKQNVLETLQLKWKDLIEIEIYKEYKTHINVSQPTFYAYFEKFNWDLYLESRPKSDKGGGMEYRYKEINIITPSLIKKDIKEIELLEEDDSFISEKMTIQQALHYYNNKSYEKSIELLSNMVRKPSKRLIENSVLYFTCLYYLGRSYYKMENYQSALQNFEKIYSFNIIRITFVFKG